MIYYLKDISRQDPHRDQKLKLFEINFEPKEYKVIEVDYTKVSKGTINKEFRKKPSLIIGEFESCSIAYEIAKSRGAVALLFNPCFEDFPEPSRRWKNPMVHAFIGKKQYEGYVKWFVKHSKVNVVAHADRGLDEEYVSYDVFYKYFDRGVGYINMFLS